MKRFIVTILLFFSTNFILSTSGDLDTTFGLGGIQTTDISGGSSVDAAYAVKIQQDDKIIVGGTSAGIFALVRYNIDGSLDSEFDTDGKVTTDMGGTNEIRALAVQSDGKILAAGTKGNGDFPIARYQTNGALDTSFDTDGKLTVSVGTSGATAYALAVQPDGKILVAGLVDSNKIAIIRLNPTDGSLDTAGFNAAAGLGGVAGKITKAIGTSTIIYCMAVQSDGKIVVAGASDGDVIVARFLADGSALDTAGFNNPTGYIIQNLGGTDAAYGIGLQSDGKIVVSGSKSGVNIAIARFTTAGLLDSFANDGASPFGTGGAGAQTGYNVANNLGSIDVAVAYGMVVQSDDKIVIGGVITNTTTLTNFVIARYLADGSDVDTSFNTVGYRATDISGANSVDTGRAIAIQPNGKFVVSGTTDANSNDFAVVRYLGDTGVQGCMDVTYDPVDSDNDGGFKTYPTDSTSSHKPQVKSLQVLSDNTVYVVTENLAVATKSQLVKLAADGTVSATVSPDAPIGGSDVIVDSQSRALVVGTNGTPRGWIARYKVSAGAMILDTTFNSGSVLVNNSSTSYKRVVEQKSGRIIAMGQTNSDADGIVVAYTQSGVVDTSFGASGVYTALTGAVLMDILIDANDELYIIYKVTSGNIKIRKIKADGSGLDTAYSTGGSPAGVYDTGLLSASYGSPSMTFDNNGKIIIAAVVTSSGNIAVSRLTTNASSATNLTIYATQGLGAYHALSSPVITKLQCDTNNRPMIAGYDANNFFIARIKNDITSLDTTFASYSVAPGVLKSSYDNVNPTRVVNSVSISPNGSIVFGGYENIDGSHTVSVVGRVVGDSNPYSQVARYPGAVLTPGIVDTTFNAAGTDAGFINLTTELGAADVPTTHPSKAKKMLQLSGGSYFVATDDGVTTYINKFTSSDVIDTSFASGRLAIAVTGISDLFLDQSGNLVVVGGSGGSGSDAGWIAKYDATGTSVVGFTATVNLDQHVAVRQQTNSRLIVAGIEDGAGTLLAYNSVTGAVDTTFGVNGRCVAGSTVVDSMLIGSDDVIYFISNNGSNNPILQSVSADGAVAHVTSVATTGTVSDHASSHLAFDEGGKIVVVTVGTAASPYIISLQRFTTGLVQSGSTLNLANADTGFTHPAVTSIVIDQNSAPGKIIVTGVDASGPTPFVIRITSVSDISSAYLDTTFNATGIQQFNTLTNASGTVQEWYDAIITQTGKIKVAGYATISAVNKSYLMSLYGDDFIVQYTTSVSAGTAGTLDANFGASGSFALDTLGAGTPLAGATPLAVLPTSLGSHYIVFDNGDLILLTNDNVLDTTNFNPGAVTNPAGFAVNDTPVGAFSMMMDGSSRLVVAGTNSTGAGHGWVQRYVTGNVGKVDTVANGGIGFNTTGSIDLGNSTQATKVVEQTSGRLVVAGKKSNGHGALFAFTNTGVVDTLFGTNGVYDTGVSGGIYGLACDQYDRLIVAYVYSGGGAAYVTRLTPTGELDTTFGFAGSINGGAGAIVNATIENQVRLVLDASGNIVVVAYTWNGASHLISIASFDNGTSTVANSNGAIVDTELDISGFTNVPVLTDVIATADGKILIAGSQTDGGGGTGTAVDMWVARVKNSSGAYVLDTTFSPSGLIASGIMSFHFSGASNPRTLQAITMYGDGEISMIGAETFITTAYPFLARAYNVPFTTQTSQSPNSESAGTNDTTLGLTGTNGLLFYASSGATAVDGQVARAVAMQGNIKMILACDGGDSSGPTPSRIFLNIFNIDGILDPTFNTTGRVELSTQYDNEYVKDMIFFTTTSGINKVILAGYVASSSLGINSSLLAQYDVTTPGPGFDTTFGGMYQDVIGTISNQAAEHHVVGRQSSGRIIAGGLNYDNAGLLLAYTAAGRVDKSFGADGYFVKGTTGIYTHAIDSLDRVVIAYSNSGQVILARVLADGSGLDTSFNGTGSISTGITGILSNSCIRVAIDGSGNILVATINNSGANLVVRRYVPDGSSYVELIVAGATDLGTAVTAISLAKLLVDTQGKAIIVGSCTDAGGQWMLVVRTTTGITALDAATFNTTGFLKYKINASNTVRQATHGAIQNDGRVLIAGKETA